MLNSITIRSQNFTDPERLVVILHGYGTSGGDFAEVGKIFLSKQLDNTVFLFPDAPYECGHGGCGKQWFDLSEMSYSELRNGLDLVSPILYDYIKNSIVEHGCSNVNLIGFSQGAILAFEMLYYHGISKIVAYSGIFAIKENSQSLSNAEVLIVHSDDDEVVPYKNATLAKENLDTLRIKSRIKTCHNIGHTISVEGWTTGVAFLKG
ncbi:MAG: hypothetical protein LBB34_03835 [Holosporales bacterium]|jgi:predicted esterase|nr:hypothetical protein [Holosporales bacterium]